MKKIGLPSPELLVTFVGSFEIVCGRLILLGLLSRLSSISRLVIMLVAITTSKSEVLVNDGFWIMMRGSQTDSVILLGSLFLLIKGAEKLSKDLTFQKIVNNGE